MPATVRKKLAAPNDKRKSEIRGLVNISVNGVHEKAEVEGEIVCPVKLVPLTIGVNDPSKEIIHGLLMMDSLIALSIGSSTYRAQLSSNTPVVAEIVNGSHGCMDDNDHETTTSLYIASLSASQEVSQSCASVPHQNPLKIFGGNLKIPVIVSPEKKPTGSPCSWK